MKTTPAATNTAGAVPATGVDLTGLLRFDFVEIDGDHEQFIEVNAGGYFLAAQVEARIALAAAPSAAALAKPDTRQAIHAAIGKLIESVSNLPHLFPDGCKEPGALLRQSEVMGVLLDASRALRSNQEKGGA